ncbi:Bug family tripartite tricarboxylate transporter substrate binding protein [Pararoseomonas indoligenes]|uniref:Tripartite tricarboxylate transporter substrate binding protein n=1 Tax=Roseomonas indoligenes TaxID=2820811 RepID=A0A940SAB1_9PROT|nr:tripartite tricarboxylate transporter substrate binding protein [Pararoseomonas indoligenes]
MRLVAPFPPGSGTDVLARLLAPVLSRELGQPVVVDNRPGANGIVGSQSVATAAPDGYSLLILGTSAAAINPHTIRRMPYDVARDFAMVGMIGETPYILCVGVDGPRDLPSFLAFLREKPGGATFSYGNAGAMIMATVMGRMLGVPVTPVPYRGGAEAITDVAAGRVDANFADYSPALAQAQTGRIRMIGHSIAHSFAVAPELPSVSSVLPGFDMNVWWSIAAPAGTPQAIIERAGRALNATMSTPEIVERLRLVGDTPLHMSPEETTRYVAAQHAAWGERVRLAGIEPQ